MPDWDSQLPPSLTRIFQSFADVQEAATLERRLAEVGEAASEMLPPSERAKLSATTGDDGLLDSKKKLALELFNMSSPAERLRCTEMLNDPRFSPEKTSLEWGPNAEGEHTLFYFIAFHVDPFVYADWLSGHESKTAKAALQDNPGHGVSPELPSLPALWWGDRVRTALMSQLGRARAFFPYMLPPPPVVRRMAEKSPFRSRSVSATVWSASSVTR